MVTQFNTLKSYIFPIILLLSILLGGLTGYVFNQNVAWLKPFGDIFLNLIFTTIVPLIFSVYPQRLQELVLLAN